MRRVILNSTGPFIACLALAACDNAPPPEETSEVEAEAAAPARLPDVEVAPEDIPTFVHDRHEKFEEISDAFKPIGEALKGDDPDVAMILEKAQFIEAGLTELSRHFPAGTGPEDGFKTEALQIIWAQKDDFNAKFDSALAAAGRLTNAAQGDYIVAIRAAATSLGKTCKDCHETYREEHD